jgi:putative N6-adenine-specific DNA methylase
MALLDALATTTERVATRVPVTDRSQRRAGRAKPLGSRAPASATQPGRAGSGSAGLLEIFCACAPGLEALLSAELAALGLGGEAQPGGALLRGSLREVLRANLRSRIASRVLVRLGSFRATSFEELSLQCARLPFEEIVRAGAPVSIRATCRKSRLYHSGAVAERVHQALEARLGAKAPLVRAGSGLPDGDEAEPRHAEVLGHQREPGYEEEPSSARAQLLLVRFEHDRCTVSADASGALLHRRGYRTHTSQAPLRETLAAALLAAAGYQGGPLVDPLCGAGTIPLEAALLASRRAPGAGRSFACERWPAWSGAWIAEERKAALGAVERDPAAQISGSDLDPRALDAARANATSAQVAVQFSVRDLLSLRAQDFPRGALVATNPPYGQRVGEPGRALIGVWEKLGSLLREANLRAAILCPSESLQRALGAGFRVAARTQNGGIPVSILLSGTALSTRAQGVRPYTE